jgi:hypothetical protein
VLSSLATGFETITPRVNNHSDRGGGRQHGTPEDRSGGILRTLNLEPPLRRGKDGAVSPYDNVFARRPRVISAALTDHAQHTTKPLERRTLPRVLTQESELHPKKNGWRRRSDDAAGCENSYIVDHQQQPLDQSPHPARLFKRKSIEFP